MYRYIKADRNLSDSEKEDSAVAEFTVTARKPKPKKKHSTGRGAPREQQRKGRMTVPDPDVVAVDTVAYDQDLSLNIKYSSTIRFASMDTDTLRKLYENWTNLCDEFKTRLKRDDLYTVFSAIPLYAELLDEISSISTKWGDKIASIWNKMYFDEYGREYFGVFSGYAKKTLTTDYDKAQAVMGCLKGPNKNDKSPLHDILKRASRINDDLRKKLVDSKPVVTRIPDAITEAIGTERKNIKQINLALSDAMNKYVKEAGANKNYKSPLYFAAMLKRLEDVAKTSSFSEELVEYYLDAELSGLDSPEDFEDGLKAIFEKAKSGFSDETFADFKLQGEIFRMIYYKNVVKVLKTYLNTNNYKNLYVQKSEFQDILDKTDKEGMKEFYRIFIDKVKEITNKMFKDEFDDEQRNILMEGFESEDLDDPTTPIEDLMKRTEDGYEKYKRSLAKNDQSRKELYTREEIEEKYRDYISKLEAEAAKVAALVKSVPRFISRVASSILSSYEDSYLGKKEFMKRNATYHGVLIQGHPSGPTNSGWNSIDKRYKDNLL